MGSTERRQREKEEMRRLVTTAAMKLFLAEGFERTSIRRIAEEIEYTPGAIYSYFKDKDEILYALHTEGMDRLFEALKPVDDIEDPAVAIDECCRRYLTFAVENREYYDLMFIMEETGHKILEKKDWTEGLRTFDVLRRCVYRGMEAGFLVPANPEIAAFTLWSTVHGMLALLIRNRCPMFPEEMLPTLLEGARHYLLATLKAASTAAQGERPELPTFVALAGLKLEGACHLRAFPQPPAAAEAPAKAPRRRRATKPKRG